VLGGPPVRIQRVLSVLAAAAVAAASHAAVTPVDATRFDGVVRHDPTGRLGIVAESPDEPGFESERSGWAAFAAKAGGSWRVWLDRRSGAPTLVEGSGIPWHAAGRQETAGTLEQLARAFVREHGALLKVSESELVLAAEGTGFVDPDHAVVVFHRAVGGIPVEEQRLVFYVTRGNLVSFGADRWGRVGRVPDAVYGVETTRELLTSYAGIAASEEVEWIESGVPVLLAAPPDPQVEDRRWRGEVGGGIAFRLAHRFVLRVADTRGTWVGKVDATTGEVLAFYDDDRYGTVRGGVFPVSNDGNCANNGCELVGIPMPWADLTADGSTGTTGDSGQYECTGLGGTVSTTLSGPYVDTSDACGPTSGTGTCDDDLDLLSNSGFNCGVPPGSNTTGAARTGFYHVNRMKEKARYWLPLNTWVTATVVYNANVNNTCNASWGGQINMYRAGNGCGNTGELSGVVNHEYGHGLDQNDGGGYDNSSETYADVVAMLQDRRSCVGRGFYADGRVCSGYGDTCLTCTGIRDHDHAARIRNTPSTPANFIDPNCGSGSGPCGRQVHCESYPPADAMFDLATRDLPASGLDAATSWQLAEKLFYKSRQGSGGNTQNCSLPNSDGCGTTNWFQKLRNADDDDGNLSNGTPHGAAIFAAFNRHAIACGSAGDASNQSTSSCPSLAAPVLTTTAGSNSASLSWTAVTGAARYLVLRSELGCDTSQNVVATVDAPATSYVDVDLPNELALQYRVQAQGSNTACESPVSTCESVTPQPFAGSIKLDRPSYGCSSVLTITVRDANVGASTTIAEIWSSVEPAPETVVLTETAPGSAKYLGTIVATGGPAAADGLLSLAHGASITARYVDADDGLGGSGIERTTGATADCVYPQISGVQTQSVTTSSAVVKWTTDEASSTVVRWGELKPPANTKTVSGLTTAHQASLTGLQSCTVYWYEVESEDAPGNAAVDDRGGQYYSFETLGDFGGGPQPCHAGKLTVQKSVVGCSDSLPVKVVDIDLNASPTAVDTVQVTVSSSTETTAETLLLVETGANTSIFQGSIATAGGAAVAGDGVVQIANGDLVTATYQDVDDGSGVPAVSFQTALADCGQPPVSAVRVTDVTDEGATVRWETAEPATSRVDWGPTAALGSVAQSSSLVTSHALTLSGLSECGRFFFRVTSTDAYGNTRVLDAGGVPFEFNAYRIPGVFRDEFESLTGWTLEGEWQIGSPEGEGTSPGDPTVAFQGTKVLGHDLTGLGSRPGDYESGVDQRAISPVIDGSALVGARLKIRRWLNSQEGTAKSFIQVRKNGVWNTVWTGTLLGETASSWSLLNVDVAAFADGNPNLQIAFRQTGGAAGAQRAGWNVDRFVLKDASTPEYDVCGGCTGAPSFAGVASAKDAAGCADTGVQLTWQQAPGWGTGHAGTYAVYRDTDPAFVPSAGNRIAAGISGTSYTDVSAPNGVTLHYVVRAENDEACSTGPSNGGVTDSNVVRLSAKDEVGQPAPGDVGGTLRAATINDAHVRLTWSGTGTAASYRVYRAQLPQGPFTQIADVAGTLYEDKDQLADSANRYYTVKAVDSCGNEGP
jgi:hypothetical protein